ncbi:MAG: sodium-dependent transporter [Candidatus Eisenbacteria bacterium]|uniref:Sodium-dependent transporter n=1 Tax=Eiseniibacteriota bacterium TaxID=2212470 RepID=A0A948W6B5_UNCEI|nr:sodium-dependent transporter [Candidatus Eisenbacteria bacterium]MBU2690940.1 sodium-dependent transporter [Candidatus Eisenbacteria bacterium]
MENTRGQWKSQLGFILAASGSAIGLGNIVFFSANAYKFGGGAFYLPYFFALLIIGIPVMILEFGLGHHTGRSFPVALRQTLGRKGEFLGWFGIINASFITMYYITILAWVVGMFVGSFGSLWHSSVAVPPFGLALGDLPNPYAFFFRMLSNWSAVIFVIIVWFLNVWIVRRGATTIESAVKIFVPLMWLFMIFLIIRGITLPNGIHGLYLLFTPNLEVMKNIDVWQGAFSQIFFTLSLGFGIMTAYASYLPKKSDQTNNALITSFLNCGFEYIAGIAIFTILFATTMIPKASTISMMFFIVPSGISKLPGGDMSVILFGIMFFVLLLFAGLSSSISLVEAFISAMVDKFQTSRKRFLIAAFVFGGLGSIAFALPQVINRGLEDDGTLGFTLLDLIDHWAFSHGLLIVGLIECLLIGWIYGVKKIRQTINMNSRYTLGSGFDFLIKFIIPALILFVLVASVVNEIREGLYGSAFRANFTKPWGWLQILPHLALFAWITISVGGAAVLTLMRGYKNEESSGELKDYPGGES